ncbi:hypothetical protein [Psychroserpens sp.]|uniref:hypothetical protein n=1 Tax=Psychroserpens sp. TaxID=2020870 RepID=UPI00385BE653
MKIKFLSILSLAVILFTACTSDSTSEEFDDNNPDAVARLITEIAIVSAQNPIDNTTISVSYDANNRVTSITDGVETNTLVYNNDDSLTNVAGPGETLNVQDLYDDSPFEAFEYGEVIDYDSNNNPLNIRIYDYEYNFNTGMEETIEYRALITYDDKPNPYFYTLQAAGAIEIMDNVELNFSSEMNAPELIQARLLFPSRNVSGVTITNLAGQVLTEVVANYVYNSDNYPTSGTITETSYENGMVDETNVVSMTYAYLVN